MTEDEARQRVIRSMCPERVCRVCGQPSVRVSEGAGWRQAELAAHIKERREAAGVTSDEINGWFGYREIAKNWERTDPSGARVPNWKDWPILKERLGLSDEFDAVIRQLDGIEYIPESGPGRGTDHLPSGVNPSGRGFEWHEARRVNTSGFTDCGHDDWRPGVWLDPFAELEEA